MKQMFRWRTNDRSRPTHSKFDLSSLGFVHGARFTIRSLTDVSYDDESGQVVHSRLPLLCSIVGTGWSHRSTFILVVRNKMCLI